MDLPGPARIREEFDQAASRYDRHAVLEQEVGSRLMERLAFGRKNPERILDLGCGTGFFTRQLKRRYPGSRVIGLDASLSMARQTRRRSGWFWPLSPLCADALLLPLAGQSLDLVFSNLAFQWCDDFTSLAAGLRRVLRPAGLLVFSSLGPDSLKQLRMLAARLEPGAAVRQFPDMHDVGDALLAAGFSEPVMDSEQILMEYQHLDVLLGELEGTGASSHFGDWARLVEQRGALAEAYPERGSGAPYRLTWEVLFGAAFGPAEGQPIKSPQGDVVSFSVDALRSSRLRR